MIANSQNLLIAARPRNGSGEKASETAVNSIKTSNGVAMGGKERGRRVMNHSTPNAKIAQAKKICERAMLTNGSVTASSVNIRAATSSFVGKKRSRCGRLAREGIVESDTVV